MVPAGRWKTLPTTTPSASSSSATEKASPAGVAHDQLGGVPGEDLDLEIDSFRSGLVAREAGDRPEELVLLALDLVDLANRRRIGGGLPFDGERVELGAR